MWIFLASLTMLFGAALVGFAIIRHRLGSGSAGGGEVWAGSLVLPPYLWISTLILALASLSLVGAFRAVRCGSGTGPGAAPGRWIGLSLLLGLAFVTSQLLNLTWLHSSGTLPQTSMAAYAVYILSALHGLHVLGGLIAMSIVLVRARLGAYGPESHAGVRYLGIYWHYLGAVWVVIWVVLAV